MRSDSCGGAVWPDPIVVAIDGPAGSGKSSVARAAAERLGFDYLDTGAAYRALAWVMARDGVDPAALVDAAAFVRDAELELARKPYERWVRVDGTDVSDAIRSPAVSAAVSAVAKVPTIRVALNDRFRELIALATRGIVVEGRDITTVVAPDAQVRLLLTASPEVRAQRRLGELGAGARSVGSSAAAAAGGDAAVAVVAAAIAARDAQDSRVVDFTTPAPGVETVDSTELGFEETVEAVLALVRPRIGAET